MKTAIVSDAPADHAAPRGGAGSILRAPTKLLPALWNRFAWKLTTALAMLPLAWGIGHGGDMLRPLAIGLIGALCISMAFSLIATPTVYCLIMRLREKPAVRKLEPHD